MFAGYQPLPRRYDELLDGQGRVRPRWRDLTAALEGFDSRTLFERRIEQRRLLREHGVTYNIYQRGERGPSPWAMDLLPVIISSREWREVEVGIAQRAELLRLLLADIYGAQTLIQRGLLPAGLVFAHPGFLLPCWGSLQGLDAGLAVYAADLGRGPDGQFWVTADRTQAPSGIGYALEARMISSRVLPSVFREANVHPVLPFLRALRRSLTHLAGGEVDTVAVLTPGRANETYSEQAYLARGMGVPLVEGGDLFVEDGRCWMRVAQGRQPIRALLRRMDDGYADPLELNRQSVLGTPGLLQCVRNRSLAVANTLGSGVLENPALMRYLPQICRALLGEDLKLRSAPTWWCGEPEDCDYVLAHVDELLLRDLREVRAPRLIALDMLEPEARDTLWAELRERPQCFAAHPRPVQGGAPVLTRQGVEARSVELRTFACAEGDSYRVMSGGLARAGHSEQNRRISGQAGGLCKDIWVLSSEPVREAPLLPLLLPPAQARVLHEPHTADSLLWTGRYLVRAELLARMLQSVASRLHERGDAAPDRLSRRLCEALTWQSTRYPGFVGPVGAASLQAPVPELLALCCGDDANALAGVLRALRQSTQSVRHLFGAEVCRLLDGLGVDAADAPDLDQAAAACGQQALQLAAIHGLLLRSLPESGARQLLLLGLQLESALGNLRLLRSLALERGLAVDTGGLLLEWLHATPDRLEEAEHGTQAALLHATWLSAEAPSAVRYQLMRMESALRSLPPAAREGRRLEAQITEQLVELGATALPDLLDPADAAVQLDRKLAAQSEWLRGLADGVLARFVPPPRAQSSQLVQTA